jgi:hypothetical protein
MFVITAIEPATSLVSAQMRPMIVPPTSTATIAASQYRIRRLVMMPSILSWGVAFRQWKPPSRSCHPCIQIPKGVASPAIMLPKEEHAREYVVARLWDRPNRAAGTP